MFQLPPNIIPRPLYIERIKPFIGKQLIKVLTGHRRVGKSFILYQIIQLLEQHDSSANIIYINKEDLSFEFLSDYHQLDTYVRERLVSGVKNYLFIDEVQEIDGFHLAVRSLALIADLEIYITGSNSKLLSTDIANLLGGRYIKFEVFSLSYLEFLEFHKLENNEESFLKYEKIGGLPYLINLPLEEGITAEYITGIYSTVIFRDVVRRNDIRNTRFLEQLVYYLAKNVGNLFSSKSISDFLKSQKINISPNQVSEYAEKMTDAYLIQKAKRYDIIGKKNFEIGEKYYFENLGILNLLAPLNPSNREKYLENLVYNHLRVLGYKIEIGVVERQEIDFIASKNNQKIYFQVSLELKSQETIEREIGNLLKIKDNFPKYVITEDRGYNGSQEGIRILNIKDFLSKTSFTD